MVVVCVVVGWCGPEIRRRSLSLIALGRRKFEVGIWNSSGLAKRGRLERCPLAIALKIGKSCRAIKSTHWTTGLTLLL